jgi:hypothetical protein
MNVKDSKAAEQPAKKEKKKSIAGWKKVVYYAELAILPRDTAHVGYKIYIFIYTTYSFKYTSLLCRPPLLYEKSTQNVVGVDQIKTEPF